MANRNPQPPASVLGPKRDAEMPAIDDPEMQLDVYQGETMKARKAAKGKRSPMAAAMRRRLDAKDEG
jgi:hypothetical protein